MYYRTAEDANLVCGPISAEIVDDAALEQAKRKISGDDAEWVFPVAEATVTRTPSDKAALAKIKGLAVPVLNTFPAPVEGQEVVPTHYEVLLASGRAGWVSAEDVRPVVSSRMCYALTSEGEWKIVLFDEAE